MTSQVWRPIRNDLHRILLGITGIPDVHWEGHRFVPVLGVPWLREAIEKGPAFTDTFGSYGRVQEQSVYLLDLNWPATGVFSDGEDLADRIRLTFWHGREIASSGPDYISGRVVSTESRRTVKGDVWTIFPIRVTFWLHRETMQGAF